jgi:hypothetical protein
VKRPTASRRRPLFSALGFATTRYAQLRSWLNSSFKQLAPSSTAAATVESASSMESFSTAESAMGNRYLSTSFIATPRETVCNIPASNISAGTVSGVSPESGAIVSAGPERMSPAVVPGASSDENTACEPLWSVVSVWGASIRSIGVIAVGANGRPGNIARADANTDSDGADADSDANLRRRGRDRD